jgi:hypothetical protein
MSKKTGLITHSEPKTFLFALLVLVLSSKQLAAQGLPVNLGSQIPVAIWFIGTAVLGLVMAWAILHNRRRTRAEKRLTEEATKQNYANTERDRINSGSV